MQGNQAVKRQNEETDTWKRKEDFEMSGHSKFANIKHKKEKNDAAKGKIFTIIGREIAVAVKEGGPDPANNSKLAAVVAKAKANNMPNDTIDRGIKKAAGDANSVNYEYVSYEGYGPCGIAIIVDARSQRITACRTTHYHRPTLSVKNTATLQASISPARSAVRNPKFTAGSPVTTVRFRTGMTARHRSTKTVNFMM